jgi:hypothetical protein
MAMSAVAPIISTIGFLSIPIGSKDSGGMKKLFFLRGCRMIG